ncbi:MAG: hypothetical protein CMM61_03415 [Rhodospirillaceae bacterium]|nr:hypothetical protein [Rhodospirillaceae bacterium]
MKIVITFLYYVLLVLRGPIHAVGYLIGAIFMFGGISGLLLYFLTGAQEESVLHMGLVGVGGGLALSFLRHFYDGFLSGLNQAPSRPES